jgi:hypothetical protein
MSSLVNGRLSIRRPIRVFHHVDYLPRQFLRSDRWRRSYSRIVWKATRVQTTVGQASRSPSPGAFSNASSDCSAASSNPSVRLVARPDLLLSKWILALTSNSSPTNNFSPPSTKETMEVPAEGPVLQTAAPLPGRFPTVHPIKEEVSLANGELVPKADEGLDCLEPSTRTVSPSNGKPRKPPTIFIESSQEDSFQRMLKQSVRITCFCEVITDCPSALRLHGGSA